MFRSSSPVAYRRHASDIPPDPMSVWQPLHPAFAPWRSPTAQLQVVMSPVIVRLVELDSFIGLAQMEEEEGPGPGCFLLLDLGTFSHICRVVL
jgi:hypothetical protein